MNTFLALLLAALACPAPCRAAEAPVLRVLCYHRVGPEKKGDAYQISPKRFESQLRWLKAHGFQSVRFADCLGGFTRCAKPVLITFDDGYESGWTVAGPILKRQGFTAGYFIHPRYVGKKKRLNWDQVAAMERQGFEIGSHSHEHSNMGFMQPGESEEAYARRLEDEAAGSKRDLEARLGHPVTAFAYPYGAWNHRVERAVKAAGYTMAFTATKGVVLEGDAPFRLKRILFAGITTPSIFKRAMALRPTGSTLVGIEDGATVQTWGGRALTVTAAEGVDTRRLRAWLGKEPLPLSPLPGGGLWAWLPGPSKPGYFLLKVADGELDDSREDTWLVQATPAGRVPLYQ